MLAIDLPPNACRTLQFGFVSAGSHTTTASQPSRLKTESSDQEPSGEHKKETSSDDHCVQETHNVLREVHRTIFDEQVSSFAFTLSAYFNLLLILTLVNRVQVFDLVNREAFNPSLGVNVTGIRENYLELSINQEASVFISLQPSGHGEHLVDGADIHNSGSALVPLESNKESDTEDRKKDIEKKSALPKQISCEIYLQQIFHDQVFVRAKNRTTSAGKLQSSGQPATDRLNLLGHFCLSLAHRIFSNKILGELENLV